LRRAPSILLFLLSLFLLFPGPLLPVGAARADSPLIADLDSHLIAITTGFSGTQVLLFGTTDGPADVIVVVRGPAGLVTVQKKSRVMGVWANRSAVVFSNVPAYYGLAASRPLQALLPWEMQVRYQLGIEQLRITTEEANALEIGDYYAALVRRKRAQGLFTSRTGRVVFIGDRLFRVNIEIPSTVPTGSYLIDVLMVRNGQVVSAQTTPLVISKTGFGADIYEFAYRHSALYGLSAILLSLGAGWCAHLIFRRR